jgi:hypothetical protein
VPTAALTLFIVVNSEVVGLAPVVMMLEMYILEFLKIHTAALRTQLFYTHVNVKIQMKQRPNLSATIHSNYNFYYPSYFNAHMSEASKPSTVNILKRLSMYVKIITIVDPETNATFSTSFSGSRSKLAASGEGSKRITYISTNGL